MAQSFTTQDGITLINPGTYVSVSVKPNQGNIGAAGVVTLIGEADEGPGFLDESDLSEVAYSPSQYGQVLQKYGSGRIVDAFKSIISAANDPNILGSVTLVRIIKTNQSAKSSGSILGAVSQSFANVLARKAGLSSNLIKFKSEVAQIEVAPTTGFFVYVPHASAVSFGIRINGQDLKSVTIPLKTDAVSVLIEDVAAGIMCKGGAVKSVEPSAGLTLSASVVDSERLLVSLQTGHTFAQSPSIGDTAIIPANGEYSAAQNSVIGGMGGANCGTYIVESVTNTITSATLTLKRVSTVGTLVSASGSTSADLKDIFLLSQIEIKNMSGDRRLSTVGVSGTYNVTQNDGANVVVQAPANFANQPKTGDIVKFESAFAGVAAGFYQVISSTANTMTTVRLSDGSSGSGAGSQTVSIAPTASTEPFKVIGPVVSGLGKSLCIEGDVEAIFLNEDGSSAGLSNQQRVSQSELKNQMTYMKGTITESFKSGGDIVMSVGCTEASAQMDIQSDKIVFSVNSVIRFTATFKQFKTLSDLAAFISSQTNFSASLSSPKFSNVNPSSLDKGTYDISGIAAHKNGRIKKDAADFLTQNSGSALVEVTLASNSGLPEAKSEQFMTGGAKNGTTSALAAAAIDAVEKLDTNFIVPLFSVDADQDITNEETESSSTYTVDAINAYLQAHVLKMSAVKMRKNRIGIASKKDTYSKVKDAAGELNSFRMYLCFEDVKAVNSNGSIVTFQPWMAAVNAAGMQAAAGYKGIVKKFANVSGIQLPYGDFDPSNPGDTEDALKAGLLFMERVPTGGFRWFSDQSTYTVDNNFVYNSLQAVYLSDLIVLTLIDRFDRLVVGKSVAEVSATAALSILEAEMFNFKRLRWIAESDDAIKGFKNATVKISGPVLEIGCEIKLAGLIYFVPISLSISEVQQTA